MQPNIFQRWPKGSHGSFCFKIDSFKITPKKLLNVLAYSWKQTRCQDLSKIAQQICHICKSRYELIGLARAEALIEVTQSKIGLQLTSTNCSQIQKSIYCKNSLTVTACCVNLLTIFRSRTEMLFPRIDASKFERYFQTRSSPLRKLSTTAQSTSHGHRGLGGLRRR